MLAYARNRAPQVFFYMKVMAMCCIRAYAGNRAPQVIFRMLHVFTAGAELTVMPNGEHWFHTEEQMQFLDRWITA